jgi:hypothetical protein
LAIGNANNLRRNMEKSPTELAKEALLLPARVAAFVLDHLQIKAWSEFPADPNGPPPASITVYEAPKLGNS